MHLDYALNSLYTITMAPELMTLDETSEFLHLKRQTLLIQVRRNLIPYVRVGKKILFHAQALRLWVLESLQGPAFFVAPIRRYAARSRRRLAEGNPAPLGSAANPLTAREKRSLAKSEDDVRKGRLVPLLP